MMEMAKFFDKKKWDLSSNSSDEDESKRPREPSLDDSAADVANTDVSTESLNSEDCVAIIYSCMKKL